MKFVYSMTSLLLALSACGHAAAANYVGQWVNVKNECRTLAIEKNGSNFLVKVSEPSTLVRKLDVRTVPAMMKNDMLYIEMPRRAEAVSVNEQTGNLMSSKGEYRRVLKDDKVCKIPLTAEPYKMPHPSTHAGEL